MHAANARSGREVAGAWPEARRALWATVLDAGLRLRLGALEWRDVDLAVVLDSVEPSMHAVGAVIFRKT